MSIIKTSSYIRLCDILQEMGYVLFEDLENDFSISDYINDSITFIEFIIKIEEDFEIELSDDFLSYELLESAQGLANKIDSYLKKDLCGV